MTLGVVLCVELAVWLRDCVREPVCVRLALCVSLNDCDWLLDCVWLGVPLTVGDRVMVVLAERD